MTRACPAHSAPRCLHAKHTFHAVWLVSLAACAAQHAGGVQPGDDERDTMVANEAAPAPQPGSDAPTGSAAPDAAISSTAPDASFDSVAADAAKTTCRVPSDTCVLESTNIHGKSPAGSVDITEIGVNYWSGFTQGTQLVARGDAAGQPIELRASVYTLDLEHGTSVCRPGEYRLDRDALRPSFLLYFTSCETTTDLHSAILRIDRHVGPGAISSAQIAGSPVTFDGVLTVTEPGWSLVVPFAIRKACDSWVDL